MITATAVRILPQQAVNKGWLSFQRQAMTALQKNDPETAERFFLAAFRLTSGMHRSDPRALITLASLSELCEQQGDLVGAARWTNYLINRAWFNLGPSAFVAKQMNQMYRLKLKLGAWQDASHYRILSTKISEEIGDSQEAQSQTIAPIGKAKPDSNALAIVSRTALAG